jgi:DNA polymerase (family 10)
MLKLPGLGPKRVKILYHELKITCMADLEEAAKAGRIRALKGLGAKTEQQIVEGVARQADAEQRFLRASVTSHVQALLVFLREVDGVQRVEVAGSYRRGKETVGDLDFLALADAGSDVMARFAAYDDVAEVLLSGKTKTSVVLRSGIQVDLRVVGAESFGAALHYFTGSKEHNILLRRRAQQEELKLSEYGVFRGEEAIAGDTEEAVYKVLSLPWIPPALREDRGEVDAAERDELPSLVERAHIRGDLHTHTHASDGRASIEEMAGAAQALGYQYLAVTDHSKRLTVAHGLNEDRLRAQVEEIDRANENVSDITILKGIEVDILEDGSLDLSDDVLSLLDLVVGSVHSRFKLSRDQQTERILRAMDSRYFTMLGHPTGRLLLERDPYDVDMERIIEHARQRGCFMELNANPRRLDLHEVHCRMARDQGVLVSVDTDAHRPSDLAYMEDGIAQAQRGWLERGDVLNTRTLKQLRPLLKRTMG